MECPDCGQRHAQGSPDCPMHRVGSVVAGRFRIVRLIGAGGMGAVFEAEHLALGTRVALKTILARVARGSDAVARFQREARAVADVHHPGIVDVKDLGLDDDGSPFMVLELLEGRDAWSLLEDGPLPVERAVWIISEALDALEVAHERGIIHRDLKPANLFVARDPRGGERVKILDFGLAKVLEAERVALTRTGHFMGSAPYMSPEQTQDAKRVDERCDVYGMGVTLFELLTGRLPVEGDNSVQMMIRVGAGEIQRHPRVLRPDVPEWLDAVVARALAHDPAQRWVSALEMKAALQAGPPSSADDEDQRATQAFSRVAADAPTLQMPESAAAPVPANPVAVSSAPTRSRATFRLVVALSVLLALALAAALVWSLATPAEPPMATAGPGEPVAVLSVPPSPPPWVPPPPSTHEGERPAPPSPVPPIVAEDPPLRPFPDAGAGDRRTRPRTDGPTPRRDSARPGRPEAPDAPVARDEPAVPDARDRMPPLPESGGAGVPETPSRGELYRVLGSARGDVLTCARASRVGVTVTIAGTGRVIGVVVDQEVPAAQAQCVRNVVRALVFPRFALGQETLRYDI